MKDLILIILFISCTLADLVSKDKRKFSSVGIDESNDTPDCDCDDPCYDCDIPAIRTSCDTQVICQDVYDRTILVCTKESYFDRIEFRGSYKLNTTCTGVLAGIDGYSPCIYKGIDENDNDCRQEEEEDLNAEYYEFVTICNEGDCQTIEEAKLKDCKCKGDTLRSVSKWVSVGDQITSCCHCGLNHQRATFFKLNIFGNCCSECYLLQASLTFEKPINSF